MEEAQILALPDHIAEMELTDALHGLARSMTSATSDVRTRAREQAAQDAGSLVSRLGSHF